MLSTWHSNGTPKPANLHWLDYMDEGLLGLTYSEFFCVHRTMKYSQQNCLYGDAISFLSCVWKVLFRQVSSNNPEIEINSLDKRSSHRESCKNLRRK